ncbi:PREDICTED: prefoldin subunit 1 [Nicrophorus vespilloides]|uniref:Prefoldin subunit 1 n=1 Tax=Nicrophorus vespilloides TaxID=110193 RepID=A0ABM1N3T9_NICVS|nr:PREDICTED: prefoldin subunit 1 [Nicrophorus vespilloides]
MSKVDLELKKAFGELQQKYVETSQKLKLSDLQIDTLRRAKQHASITERELSTLDSKTVMYEAVGRMFILTSSDDVKSNLKKKQDSAEEKIKNLENNKAYLERNLKEAENNIREMVQHRK